VIKIDQVQSHTNDRCVAISVKATKLTARLLAQAMQAFMKKSGKLGEKHGNQSLKSLTKSGADIQDAVIPGDSDIHSFKKIAREFNIDYAIKKDSSTDPPNWIVFFKSKQAKSMDAAFKKFSKNVLTAKPAVPPISQEMERFKDIAKGLTPAIPTKGKNKGEIEI